MRNENRIEWLDLGKAISILLVVLYHARHSTYLIDWHFREQLVLIWQAAGETVLPLRMPFFFLMSGLLAAPSLGRTWEKVRQKRVYRPMYLYGLWAVILMAVIPVFPRLGPIGGDFGLKLLLILTGSTVAWYLYALGLFFLYCRVTAKLDSRAAAVLALAIALLATCLEGKINSYLFSMMRCLFFFVVGARFREPILGWAAEASWQRLCGLAAAVVLLSAASRSVGLLANPVLDSAAVMLGIVSVALVTRHSALARKVGSGLAARTLPIYLLHFLALAAVPPAANRL